MAAMNLPRPLNNRTGYGDAERLPVTAADPPADNTPETLNRWLKTQPWYQEALKAWRITPNSPTLNPTQRLQIQEAAARAGAAPASTYAIGNRGEYEDTHELAGKVIALSIAGIAGGVGAAGLLSGGGASALSGSTPVLEGVAAGPGAASTAAGLGAAPALAGEAGVTAGLSSGLPGAVAAAPLASSAIAPTTGALAPAVASSGAVSAAAPAAGAGGASILSKTLGALTTPAVLSTIAQGAFGAYGASQAAGAQTDAAKIIADANTAAAKIQADASTQAAQIAAKGTADALAFAKQGYADQSARYEQNQEQLSPYTGAGGAAVTKLSQLLGLGTPAPYVSAVKAQAPVAPPQTGVQSMARPGTAAQQSAADAFVPNAVQSNPALSAVPQGPGPNAGTISSLAPSAQMVTLRAPTGEMAQKPAAEAQHWISLGAQPVQQGAAV